jgi:hypothetical protein
MMIVARNPLLLTTEAHLCGAISVFIGVRPPMLSWSRHFAVQRESARRRYSDLDELADE